MIITPTGAIPPTTQAALSVRHRTEAASDFAVPAGPPQPSQAMSAPVTPLRASSAMLAVQEQAGQSDAASAGVADREARKHGRDMLEALAALQKGLLSESDPGEALSLLQTLAESVPVARDPVLDDILSAIRLRARLEILRRTPISRQSTEAQEALPDCGQ